MATWGTRIVIALCSFAFSLSAQSAPASAGTTITGTVVDAGLKPLAGVVVTIRESGRDVGRTTTDANGKFTLNGIPAGDYDVVAVVTGHPTMSRRLHVARDQRELTLPLVFAPSLEEQKAREKTADAARSSTVANAPPAVPVAPPPPPAGGSTMQGAQAAGGGGGRGGGFASSGAVSQVQLAGGYRPDIYWPPISGETYAPIEANGFQRTIDRPLSTFGADVDTASYSNIRRFLSSGQLPPPDAVRIEELVNYFRFNYAEPRDGRPIALTTEVGDCPWAATHKLVLVGARAAMSASREVAGRSIVLLIDVSGSMQPAERLPLLKTAFSLFVDTLRPDDTVSIVTYAGSSGVALYPTPARQRDVIQSAIARLSAGGSTNGGEGLITAYRIARQAFIPGGVNRVILATDGDFNVGVVGQTDLLQLIEHERESGVFLSVFGVGTGNLKDRTMELLADHGNGHYAYLDSLQEARRVLIHESDATLENVAKDVKFQVEFNPATVTAWQLLGYEKREMAARDFNNDRKDGGEMGAGHTVTVLYEIVPAGADVSDDGGHPRPAVDPLKYQSTLAPPVDRPKADASHPDEWLTVKARCKAPEGQTSELLSAVVRQSSGRPSNLPFAAAVAEFGLLLRDAPHDFTRWNSLLRRVETLPVTATQVADRDAFKEMVSLAAGIARIR